MIEPQLNSRIRWSVFVTILLASSGLAFAAAKYAVAGYWAESSNPALLLRAADLEPSNGDYWRGLARYRQFDFEHPDLQQAISYYQRATKINPLSSSYWVDLAGAYETAGDTAQAEQALREAQRDYPISAQVAWQYGNFLLRQDRVQEGLSQMQRAIRVDPKMTPRAIFVCWRHTKDINQILQFALPATPDAYWGAIEFFVNAREPEAAMAVWKRLATTRSTFPLSKAFPLLDLLVKSDRVEDARVVWQQAVSAAGIVPEYEPAGSLVWDGGFEHQFLNGGLAWQYRPSVGAAINIDEETFHSGARSLRVLFDGTANPDFADLWQYVAVEPNTLYRFDAYMKTEGLTTEAGLRFEISDPKTGVMTTTRNVVGTQPWTHENFEFLTGVQTHLLQIVLRRSPSNMLSNKIRGQAWVDDISLAALPNAVPARE